MTVDSKSFREKAQELIERYEHTDSDILADELIALIESDVIGEDEQAKCATWECPDKLVGGRRCPEHQADDRNALRASQRQTLRGNVSDQANEFLGALPKNTQDQGLREQIRELFILYAESELADMGVQLGAIADNQQVCTLRQALDRAEALINTQANKLLDKLLEQKRKLLDIDTDSLVVTDRGKEHPFVEAVPVEAIEALRSSR